MQQRVYVNSESTDSSDFGPTVSRQAASIPNSSISHTLTESDSSAPPTPLMTGSPREETPEALRRQMVANAEFEDVAESLIVDLMRAIGRRKTLSEEVRSLCLAALRTLVVAHPKSIYLRPILEEKRAQQHAAAAAAASLEELAKQRKKSSQKSATTTTTTTNQSNGEDVVEDQSASKAPQKPAKGAPFPKELKYPLPFTVVEYISKVDNFNRQFLCYIDVCYGAKMVCEYIPGVHMKITSTYSRSRFHSFSPKVVIYSKPPYRIAMFTNAIIVHTTQLSFDIAGRAGWPAARALRARESLDWGHNERLSHLRSEHLRVHCAPLRSNRVPQCLFSIANNYCTTVHCETSINFFSRMLTEGLPFRHSYLHRTDTNKNILH